MPNLHDPGLESEPLCALCRAPFAPKQRTQRYCSREHMQKAADQRREQRDKPKRLAKSRAYYAANREHHNQVVKDWYRRNIEHLRTYRAERREQIAESNQRWHAEHRDEANARRLAEHYAHQEEANEKRRQHAQEFREQDPEGFAKMKRHYAQRSRDNQPWVRLIASARGRAKMKGVPFTLTLEWGSANWTGRCALTDITFSMDLPGKAGPRFFAPSIDRVVPEKGYTPDNCRFVLWAINAFKHDGTDEDMYLVAEMLIAFRSQVMPISP